MLRRWQIGALCVGLGCVPADDEPAAATEAEVDASSDTEVSTQGPASTGDPSTTGQTMPARESDCGDGVDEDGDGQLDCDDTDCQGDAACGDGRIRIATWNTLRIDAEGSPEFDALVAIVQRIDADILCVQEVGEGEESRLQAVVEATGYRDGVLAPFAGPPGAGLANACMSRLEVTESAYLWSDWISSDPGARDLTRPFVRLRVRVPGSGRFVSVVAAHFKAGDSEVDLFRRMVESIRLAQAASGELAQFPNNAVVAMGDLNDGGTPVNLTFDSLPAGLPGFYDLGNDIQLPLSYEFTAPFNDAGLDRVDARVEEGSEQGTFIPFGSRLDYVYMRGAQIVAAEVYEACNDDGVDSPPEGDVLEKAGEPLDCGLSEIASDHRPVVVDLQL